MIGAVLRWLPLSLALHAAALAATLLLPRERVLLPLFVDLTLSSSLVEPISPRDQGSAARESSASPRPQRGASAPRASASAPSASGRAATPPPPAAAREIPSTPPVPAAPHPPVPEPPAPVPPAAIPPAAPPSIAPAPEPSAEMAPPPASGPTDPSSVGTSSASGTIPWTAGTAPNGAAGGGGGGGGHDTATGAGGLTGDAGVASTGGGTGDGSETLALGIPGDDGGADAGYIALLRRRVQEALTYPSAARRRGMSGTVHLDISVEPSGRIGDVRVVRSSSHDLLDAAALDAVRTLRQVPFPPGVRPRPVRVRLPVVFELR